MHENSFSKTRHLLSLFFSLVRFMYSKSCIQVYWLVTFVDNGTTSTGQRHCHGLTLRSFTLAWSAPFLARRRFFNGIRTIREQMGGSPNKWNSTTVSYSPFYFYYCIWFTTRLFDMFHTYTYTHTRTNSCSFSMKSRERSTYKLYSLLYY